MRIVVHEDSFPERSAFDTAVSRALLRAVGAGRAPAALRLHRPGEVVAFSLLDRVQPGFREAVAEARTQGFDAILRLAGGRAAVFTRETLAFAWCVPDPEPRAAIAARFDELARVVAAALRRLGVDARIGALPGEYCPGDHSVNARGKTKLMGVGQRIVRGAAHVGGVIVLGGSARIRDVLVPVYARMGFAWDPATVGALDDEIGAISHAAVVEALLAELREQHDIEHAALPAAVLEEAGPLEAEHRVA
ncbi:MAG: lipoate--protein ligase family protein [Myxococcota bacterium]